MAPPPLPLLLQADGLCFVVLGLVSLLTPHVPAQAALFLGQSIPYPLPWVPAPFDGYITQKGLEQQWGTVLNVFRGIGVLSFVAGILLWSVGSSVMAHYRTYLEYLRRRGRRGEAVHDRVERYETKTQVQASANVRENYSPPPLLVAVLIHLACAALAHHLRTLEPLGSPFTVAPWFTQLLIVLHLTWASLVTIVAVQARIIWGGKAAKEVAEGKAD